MICHGGPASKRTGFALVATLAAVAAAPAAAFAQAPAPVTGTGQPGVIPGQYIVVMKDAATEASKERTKGRARARGGQITRDYTRALKGYAAELPPAALEDVRRDPDVAYVEADAVVTASTTQTGATWGLDRIDQRDLPLNTTYTYTPTGAGVKAYIIDTGMRLTHGQFTGRATSGYDAVDGGSADDCNGHGTHVAGTVGGTTYGVAKGVSLVAVRVLDCSGSGATSGVIAGINWVTTNHAVGQPAVANMSLGGGASSSLDTAVNNSIADGVTYAVAAGNENTNACNSSPARAANAVTVGSTTTTDARSSFSNYGTCLDVFAPGSSITSSWYTSDTATNTISGTSMASPHVAGVAALYLQGATVAPPATVASAITTTATTGKVTSPGTGSPNRLLYSPLGATPAAAASASATASAATAAARLRPGAELLGHAEWHGRVAGPAERHVVYVGDVRHAPRLSARAGGHRLRPLPRQAQLARQLVAGRAVDQHVVERGHRLQRHHRDLSLAGRVLQRQRRLHVRNDEAPLIAARRARCPRARHAADGAVPGSGRTPWIRAVRVESRAMSPESSDRKRRLITKIQVKLLNPPVKALAAHGLVPGVALLETTGRKSGLPRRTPVSKGLDRATDTFWIVAEQGAKAAYVRNIAAQPHVRVRIGKRWRTGSATILPEDDPRARQHHMSKLNAAAVRAMGTELLTIRIDLDP